MFQRQVLKSLTLAGALVLQGSFAATAKAQYLRHCVGIGINEGFASLSGYALGQQTTVTAADIASRGFGTVKIWPLSQDPAALSSVFTDPHLEVIIYRPLHHSTQESRCGLTTYWDENVDYGAIASDLYSLYGNQRKIVILTGWEADNQIEGLYGNCAWPDQAGLDAFRSLLEQRQEGVRAARDTNLDKELRVYHAVEVNQVPDAPSGNNNALEQVLPDMTEAPDFISYSAWGSGGTPTGITAKLDTIESVSGLPRDRIFVGERGCKISNSNRDTCYINHATNAFDWGVRLWNVWAYNVGPSDPDGYDLVDTSTGEDTANGFSVLVPLNEDFSSPCDLPIFSDGFESGTTGEWSATTP